MGSRRAAPHAVVLLPGDGIGPEVVAAARAVLAATGVAIDWQEHLVGQPALDAGADDPLPAAVLAAVRRAGVALKGPVSTPAGGGFRSVNVALRRELDLHLQLRFCRSLPGIGRADVDVVVIRETTEDLYAGAELDPGAPATLALLEQLAARGHRFAPDAGISLKPVSASASRRMLEAAFAWAEANGRRRVTVVHKATVMRATDGVFLDVARQVAAAHPGLAVDERQVDLAAADLAAHPHTRDVLVMGNQYGDILSDVAAAVVGGPGVVPGVNLGDGIALFEPAHGTAPRRAGLGVADPIAAIRCGALLLAHLGERAAAQAVEGAVRDVVAEGGVLPYDLTPARDPAAAATTEQVAAAVVARLA